MVNKKSTLIVSLVNFADALTGRSYRPGDEVTGWDEARATHYEARGLVTITPLDPPVNRGKEDEEQMKLDEAEKPGPEIATPASPDAGAALVQPEAAQLEGKPSGKPGPKETKEAEDEPGTGSDKEDEEEKKPGPSKSKRTRSRSKK